MNELIKMIDVALSLISKQQKIVNQARFVEQRKVEQARFAK